MKLFKKKKLKPKINVTNVDESKVKEDENNSDTVGILTSDSPQTSDFIYISLKPKWKWFKPPLTVTLFHRWEISFQWAYNIDKALELKECYPIGVSNNIGGTEIEFNCEKSGVNCDILKEYLTRLQEGLRDPQEGKAKYEQRCYAMF